MRTILDFEDFVKLHRPIEIYAKCSSELINKYKTILPEIIINTWTEHGFQKFLKGFLWTVNPDQYRYLPEFFVPQFLTSEVHVLFRTAFGDFIFLYKNQLYSYSVVTSLLLKLGQTIESFIDFNLSRTASLNDGYFLKTYKAALKKLGTITEDEIYAYIPAMHLGGEMKIENLQKQNMKSYLQMIC